MNKKLLFTISLLGVSVLNAEVSLIKSVVNQRDKPLRQVNLLFRAYMKYSPATSSNNDINQLAYAVNFIKSDKSRFNKLVANPPQGYKAAYELANNVVNFVSQRVSPRPISSEPVILTTGGK